MALLEEGTCFSIRRVLFLTNNSTRYRDEDYSIVFHRVSICEHYHFHSGLLENFVNNEIKIKIRSAHRK